MVVSYPADTTTNDPRFYAYCTIFFVFLQKFQTKLLDHEKWPTTTRVRS